MNSRVQVFARAPVSGKVKTRLIPHIGASAAARLQDSLTRHAVATALAADIGPVELCCSPDTSHPSFANLAQLGVTLRNQGVGVLGERMHRTLTDALKSANFAVLIGSDCPSLTPDDLRGATAALERGADAAFVPAEDGGYALIAVRTCSHHLFDDIEWGTGSVMEQSRSRLRELGLSWKELAPRWDIDRPEDYDRLLREQPRILEGES